MLVERVFGHPRTRAQRVRDRRSRAPKVRGKASPGLVGAPRRNVRRRAGAHSQVRRRTGLASLGSHPLVRFGTRWVSLIALGMTVWTLSQLKSGEEYRIDSVSIQGAYYMSPSRIRSIANVGGLQNYQIDPGEVEKKLEMHPEVLSAAVTLHWPNELVIELDERLPVLEWNDGGRSWLITTDGLGYLRRSSPPELNRVHSLEPVLQVGEPLSPVIDPAIVQAALDLKAMVGDSQDLIYDQEHGFGFQDAYGWIAFFGVEGDMVYKLEAYSRIVEILLQNRYPASLVSVEDVSAPYYR
jgi:hypothetical protein